MRGPLIFLVSLLAVTAVGKEMTRDARYLGLACRISAEIGAHMVKTYYTEGFEKLVRDTPVPVVIAGGKKLPELDALKMARNAIDQGASGVDMGRNIFQAKCPRAMIRAVRSVVHEPSVLEAVQTIQKREWVDRLEATVEAGVLKYER